MPPVQELLQTIERNLAGMHDYSQWTIGLTADPDRRQQELDYPGFWRIWLADSDGDARLVLRHFVEKGMRQDEEPDRNASFVYLY